MGSDDPSTDRPGDDTATNGTTPTPTGTGPSGGTDAPGTGTPTDGTPGTGTPSPSLGTDVGTQIEGFEDLEYWYALSNQGSVTAASEGAYDGSQSLRLRADGDDAFAGAFTSFGDPRDFSGKNVSLAVKIAKPELMKLSVALLAPDTDNMVRMTRTFPGPVDTWVRSDMGTTAVRGDPDLTQVQEVRLVARRRDQADEQIDVTVDDLRVADAPDTGYVTLTFDDSHESHYETAFPIMEEYGFAGVEGIISDAIYGGDRLDVGMMSEMSNAGWDMASHPYVGNTFLTEYSAEEQRRRITRNKEFLTQKGFDDGARHFLTPKNVVGPETMEIVADEHESLYTFGGMPNGLPQTTGYYNSRITAADTRPVRDAIDNAARFGQHLVLNCHAIGTGAGSLPEDDLRALLEHIDGADVEVVTCSDVLEMRSQD